ncbi:putative Ig domain-containing protein [Larkinella arboricola]|uniref:putative Ig domain-containing protein n=1 Tax=Larkinella arboricola TaxID=643671 RepID=UPI001E4058C4|nr:putative Ig domain-containing protein [Larkinella arboricola]
MAASPAAGNYDGHLDGADCETFHGWVWDRDKVNTPIAVEILDGSTVIATVLADAFRQDLLSAGKGNGQHAFYFSIPASLKDGKTHSLSARVAGGTFLLKGGAKTIVCQGGTTPPTNQPPVAPTINALTAQQGTAFSTVLPVFTDPEGGPLTYSLSGLPNGLSFNMATRQISGMPTQSGNFGLMYAATDNQNATTSLSILLTVNATTGTPVTGNFDGHLDGATCETFHGWVWDRDKVNTPILVEILDGSTVIATVLADAFRQDLLSAGKGNAQHAFYFSIPASLKDGKTHSLSARVAGGTFLLKGGAKTIMCQGGTTPPINQPPVAPTVNALTAQQGTAFSTVLPVFTDPEGGPLTYSLSGLPNGLSFNTATRQLSGTPMQSGSFGLTYAATDNQNQTTRLSVSLTVNAPATTPVTGDFDGYLDKVECGTIRGWAWDRNKPNAPVHIEFYTGNTVWGSAVANIYRDDLKNAAKGNGAHAYSFDVPTVLKDNQTRLISARIAGSGYVLKWSGKALTCSPTAGRLSAERGTELAVTVLGNPVLKDALEVEVRGAAGQSMHLQLTDAQGRVISERRVEQPHVIERQTLPLGHQPAGLLLLKTTSGSRSVILKVVKQ